MNEGKIKLFVRNSTAYVWTSDDWVKLRKNRVLGNFSGNLAALPRQDFHEGLPLAILPEEATLLVDKELAILIEAPSLTDTPNNEIKEQSNAFRKDILSEQAELMKNARKREIEKHIKQIVEGKKMKMKMSSTLMSGNNDEVEKDILHNEYNKIQDPKPSSMAVQIFMGDPWLELGNCNTCNWVYPKTDTEKLSYMTYKDLWEQGYYITPGSKFGADYLVYPGDPAQFHSFWIILCVQKDDELTPAEIIAYGRLGQSVRKTFVLAYLSSDNKVNYQSIQWAE